MFDANCPGFFAPNERAEYAEFLDEASSYQICTVGGVVAGAFGLIVESGDEGPSLRWIMIDPARQGQGIGSAVMRHVVESAHATGAATVRIAASHHSAPFFSRFGAEVVREIPDGWGPGMHRIDMKLVPGDAA